MPGVSSARDRRLPFGDQRRDDDLLAVFLDRHVVFEGRRVGEFDRHLARLAGQSRLVKGDLGRVRGQLQRHRGGSGFFASRLFATGFLAAAFFGAGRGRPLRLRRLAALFFAGRFAFFARRGFGFFAFAGFLFGFGG